MQPTEIHQTIAFQIDNQKPADLKPGVDIGMAVVDALTVRVTVIPSGVTADVRYDEGRDTYIVDVRNKEGDEAHYDDVYCDMLGDLIFGADAVPASFPMVEVWVVGDDGQMEMVI